MKLLTNKHSLYLLILLIAVDVAFIFLGIIYECGLNKLANICVAINLDEYFDVTRDRGYAEAFQYIKEYWLIILFSFLAINQNTKTYLGWLVFSIYFLIDDALSFHETAGELIGKKLNFIPLFNLRPVDYGELIVFAVVGMTFFLWLSMSYKLASSKDRKIFKYLIGLLFGLASFAIVVDLIHVMLDDYVLWKALLGIIEDGGEHIFVSLILCFVWSIVTSTSQSMAISPKKEIAYTRR